MHVCSTFLLRLSYFYIFICKNMYSDGKERSQGMRNKKKKKNPHRKNHYWNCGIRHNEEGFRTFFFHPDFAMKTKKKWKYFSGTVDVGVCRTKNDVKCYKLLVFQSILPALQSLFNISNGISQIGDPLNLSLELK